MILWGYKLISRIHIKYLIYAYHVYNVNTSEMLVISLMLPISQIRQSMQGYQEITFNQARQNKINYKINSIKVQIVNYSNK